MKRVCFLFLRLWTCISCESLCKAVKQFGGRFFGERDGRVYFRYLELAASFG